MTESDLIKPAAHPYPGKRIFVEGIEEFNKLAMEVSSNVVDARKSPENIQDKSRGSILPVMQNPTPSVSAEPIPD
ncbi:MAG: hypothetical protein U0223_04830 [Nitrospira sp.]|nr:hypothetical protein [Nitrospira sp.]